jgi:tetratricopeptide (TPR) repeat protein
MLFWEATFDMQVSFTAEEHYRRGRELLKDGRERDAFEHFRTSYNLDPANPRYRSHYGVGLALVERRFDRALELCRSAAKEEFFNPDLYHNLAQVHLAFGFKAEAIRYLRRGLMIDPGNSPIVNDLSRLGVRQSPVLRFLPRRHPMNRLLGRCRSWWDDDPPAAPIHQTA